MTLDTLKIGLLGCGPIAQFAHLPALEKARGVRLTGICDASQGLLRTMGGRYGVQDLFTDYDDFLRNGDLDAVLIASSDPFHLPLTEQALRSGKHVLVEKPLATSSCECARIVDLVEKTNLKLQVGSMKRHDPGNEFAKEFISNRIGEVVSLSGWYLDTAFRPAMQETLLPPVQTSEGVIRPEVNPKENRKKYYMATHGSHLFDNLRFFGGPIEAVTVRFIQKEDQHCWHGLLEFKSGAIGHFELTVKIHSDWSEGYVIHGSDGTVNVKTFLPFYYRPSEVRAFDARREIWETPLGAHSNPYKRQLESFARAIREDRQTNPDVYEGSAGVALIEAAQEAAETGKRVRVE